MTRRLLVVTLLLSTLSLWASAGTAQPSHNPWGASVLRQDRTQAIQLAKKWDDLSEKEKKRVREAKERYERLPDKKREKLREKWERMPPKEKEKYRLEKKYR